MTLTCRPCADADLPRLQAALAGWRREAGPCGYCHVGDLAFRINEELRGRRPAGELVLVWEDGREVAGVAICLRFGWAFDVFTSPALRGTDAELEMLRAAHQTTRRHLAAGEGGGRWVVTDVFGCDEARAALLARLGFRRYRLFDHLTERSLRGAIPPPVLPEGFAVRAARMDDAEELAGVRNSAFDAGWSAAASVSRSCAGRATGPYRRAEAGA